ncbi:MAG: PhnD/SsuA/transferrin family substrate-binding protein [Sphingobium sp.]
MIAALPMYDPPWLRAANDRLWSHIARRLRDRGLDDAPAALDREGEPEDIWASPSLLLGQACGYPLVTRLRESVQLVATPHYAAEGCEGAFHRAAIVVRRDDPARVPADLRGRRAGMNGHDSNTGMNLFRAAIAPLAGTAPFFASVAITGSHARSLAAILSNRIDAASVDAVTLALLRDRYPRHAERVRVLDWTAPSPALPLITAAGTPPAMVRLLRETLAALPADPDARDSLRALRITGFTPLGVEAYRPLLTLAEAAAALGYKALR